MQKLSTFHTTWKGQSTKVSLEELMFVEAMEDCCVLHLLDSRVMTDDSREKILSYLPEDRFLKVRHKYIVNLSHVTAINEEYVMVGTIRIALKARMTSAH